MGCILTAYVHNVFTRVDHSAGAPGNCVFYTHTHIPVAMLGLLGLPDPFPHFFSTHLFYIPHLCIGKAGAETTTYLGIYMKLLQGLTLTHQQGPHILDLESEIILDEMSGRLLQVHTGTSMEHPVPPIMCTHRLTLMSILRQQLYVPVGGVPLSSYIPYSCVRESPQEFLSSN